MNVARNGLRSWRVAAAFALAGVLAVGMFAVGSLAQTSAESGASSSKVAHDSSVAAGQDTTADQEKTAGKIVGDQQQSQADQTAATSQSKQTAKDEAQPTASLMQNAADRKRTAWSVLQDAVTDDKHPQTRIQALAALGMLRNQDSERMIGNAMLDSDMDVRTAAALAAGQTRDPNLTTDLRNLLDDKEPQVAFTAALTLAKMGDRSGEDILMAVIDGDRKTHAGVVHGTEHKISKDLHNPSKMAKLGAMQGAAMLLGPFGFGIAAIEFMHQSGGDAARAAAIEQIAQEKTQPIHNELLDALKDKDPGVRAAAAKALVDYHDQQTQDAVYTLLLDPKDPARLTAAAAYLRIVRVPGPLDTKIRPATRTQRRLPSRATK